MWATKKLAFISCVLLALPVAAQTKILGVKTTVSSPDIALVQSAQKPSVTGTSTTLAFTSDVTAGGMLAVAVRTGSATAQTYTVSDTLGNTYTEAFNGAVQSDHTVALHYTRSSTGGANTITITQTSSATIRLIIMEFSGVAATAYADGTPAVTDSTASTTATSPSITTSFDNSMILGVFTVVNGNTMTEGSGYTKIDEVDVKLATEYKLMTTAGATTATMTFASDAWGAGIAGFKREP